MTLTGISPNNPRPAIRREFIFGAGPSLGIGPERPIVLMGNKTASGTETASVLGDPIVDDADAKARFGARSELYAMYRQVAAVPQDGDVYGIVGAPSAGAATYVEFTISGASDASSGYEFHCHSEYFSVSVEDGTSQSDTADLIEAAFTNHDEGRLQVTAVAAIDGGGPDYKVTVTAAQLGDRGDLIIGATATRGLRVKATGAVNSQTCVKNTGSYSAGGATDDWSAAIADLANKEIYYHVTAKHAVASTITTDNGVGEHVLMLQTQALPINGKDQQLHVGAVGTQAQATDFADVNTVHARFFHQENSDWTPAMLAAHHCAVIRAQEIAHPGANTNGTTSSDNVIYNVPKPYLTADYPTNNEIVADLNNGVSPISYTGDRVVLERTIVSRSENSLGTKDYRAREGHIYSAITFVWAIARQRYESIRQPFADDDPTDGKPPPKLHTTPSSIRAMLEGLIDDMTSDNPLGKYDGAILKRSANAKMKKSITVVYDGAGGFPTSVDFQAGQHNIKWETKVHETGAAY